MKALQSFEYGNWEKLKLNDIEPPKPGKGEVLVQVEYVGIDSSMNHILTGTPGLVRLGFGFSKPKNPGVGQSFSGTITALGPDVSTHKVGDRVFGIGQGVFAEMATAKADKIAPIPEWLSFERAATFPVSALAANAALKLAPELMESALVIGGSGSVGSFLVQLLTNRRVSTTATAAKAKLDWVKSQGATTVIHHSEVSALPATSFDSIFVIGGNESFSDLVKLLKPGGKVIVIGSDHRGSKFAGGFLATALRSIFSRGRIKVVVSTEKPVLLLEVANLLKQNKSIAENSGELVDAIEAIRAYQSGDTRGRAVVRIGSN